LIKGENVRLILDMWSKRPGPWANCPLITFINGALIKVTFLINPDQFKPPYKEGATPLMIPLSTSLRHIRSNHGGIDLKTKAHLYGVSLLQVMMNS
jgi:hypothetical protein